MSKEEAFRYIQARYQERLKEFISRTLIPTPDKEDIMQELWISVWRVLDKLNINVDLTSYLLRALTNHIVNLHRRNNRRPKSHLFPALRTEDHIEVDEECIYGLDTSDMVSDLEAAQLLNYIWDNLEEPEREMLYYLFEDIAYPDLVELHNDPKYTINYVKKLAIRTRAHAQELYYQFSMI